MMSLTGPRAGTMWRGVTEPHINRLAPAVPRHEVHGAPAFLMWLGVHATLMTGDWRAALESLADFAVSRSA